MSTLHSISLFFFFFSFLFDHVNAFLHPCPFVSVGTVVLLVARNLSVVALPVCGSIPVDISFCPLRVVLVINV